MPPDIMSPVRMPRDIMPPGHNAPSINNNTCPHVTVRRIWSYVHDVIFTLLLKNKNTTSCNMTPKSYVLLTKDIKDIME